ncbi:MAG: hypothetical protein PHU71_02430, partial [Candidatus Gracilibacteria bacterium]|nr:hypothetical protein [Candidatus Gracilibacteria bacterium]
GPALDLVIAQRLVRRICPDCAKKVAVSPEHKAILEKEIADISKVTGEKHELPSELFQAVGCDNCSHTGYHGQIGLYEVLDINKEIQRMIMQEKPPVDIYEYARQQGMLSLREDGVLKILAGKTTIEEVLRVTADSD